MYPQVKLKSLQENLRLCGQMTVPRICTTVSFVPAEKNSKKRARTRVKVFFVKRRERSGEAA